MKNRHDKFEKQVTKLARTKPIWLITFFRFAPINVPSACFTELLVFSHKSMIYHGQFSVVSFFKYTIGLQSMDAAVVLSVDDDQAAN